MIKISKIIRSFNLLFISVCLVLTPVLGMPLPAHASLDSEAAAVLDQISLKLGLTSNDKSELGVLAEGNIDALNCLKDILQISDQKDRVPKGFFTDCREGIRQIILKIKPYLESQVAGVVLPFEFQAAFQVIKGVYTTETGNSLLNMADGALDYASCVRFIATWTVAGYVTAGGVFLAYPGAFAVDFVLSCGEKVPQIVDLIDQVTTSVIGFLTIQPPATPISSPVRSTAKNYCPNPSYSSPSCKSWTLNLCPAPNYSSQTCIGWSDSPDQSTIPGATPGTGVGAAPVPSQCTPGPSQVAVFANRNYQVPCVMKGVGTYGDPGAIGLPNDDVESVKVGVGATLQLCDNSGLNSPCEWFNQDDPDLSNNGMINLNMVSSMRVEAQSSSSNCTPSDTEVTFYMNENYDGTCSKKGIGRYDDPTALGLPNDSISSIKLGSKVKVRACDNAGMTTPCVYFEQDVPNLGQTSLLNNNISSAEVESKGGISLCDNTNYGGQCKTFGNGKTNMIDQNFYDVAESVKYEPGYSGLYHVVLWTEANQTGTPYHADQDVADLGTPFRNHIRSIEIYKHTPPNATTVSPVNNGKLPSTTTSLSLQYSGGDQKRVKVWGDSSYSFEQDWASADSVQINNLAPGRYYWQVQGRNNIGEGSWSPVATFTINTPPVVLGAHLTMKAGTTQIVQVQTIDSEQDAIALSATNLPNFAAFTNNGNGLGTLTLTPYDSATPGAFTINVAANDGELTTNAIVEVTLTPSTYQAEYFNNQTLTGSPVLAREEQVIHYDWYEGPVGSPVAEEFSARWTKTSNFEVGVYGFSMLGDPGARLYIDGQLVKSDWDEISGDEHYVSRFLSTGQHTIVMEYFDDFGVGEAGLSYQRINDGTSTFAAEYYDNRYLEGLPTVVRADQNLNFNWGSGSPDPSIGSSTFSARWTKIITTEDAGYVFNIAADDGFRFYIDGTLIVDRWVDQSLTFIYGGMLTAGQHTIVLEYYDNSGNAHAGLSYFKFVPGEYDAMYYDNINLSGPPKISRSEPSVDYDWGTGSPDPLIPNDNFSARWFIKPTFAAGTYQFNVTVDDGARLYIDEVLVLNKWTDQAVPTTYAVNSTLTAGQHTIRLESYSKTGGAVAKLSYAPSLSNIATSGTAYRWAYNTTATSNSNKASMSGLNDGNLTVNNKLSSSTESANAWEAAGVTWSTTQTGVTRVEFMNGSYTTGGVFTANMKLQFSTDGTTWTDATGWAMTPSYSYDQNAASKTYVFTGPAVSIRGARVVGQVRTGTAASWFVNATEVRVLK